MKTYQRTPAEQNTHNLRVGARVRGQRLMVGGSQQHLAQRGRMSCRRLSDIENGNRAATTDELKRLADAMNISVAAFTGRPKSQPQLF